jgi:hypothetical protein
MRNLMERLARLPWQVAFAARIWVTFAGVVLALRRHSLPEVVDALDVPPRRFSTHLPHGRISRISFQVLRFGRYRPRCLPRALVLFRLFRLQGDRPFLVIGLPEGATDKDAHAWVEVAGQDCGPPPGGAGHTALVSYPQMAPHPSA